MLAAPPLTDEKFPLAMLFSPPLTEAPSPLAVLSSPPLTDAKAALAVLNPPPLTDAKSPLISLKRPTTSPPKREKLCCCPTTTLCEPVRMSSSTNLRATHCSPRSGCPARSGSPESARPLVRSRSAQAVDNVQVGPGDDDLVALAAEMLEELLQGRHPLRQPLLVLSFSEASSCASAERQRPAEHASTTRLQARPRHQRSRRSTVWVAVPSLSRRSWR